MTHEKREVLIKTTGRGPSWNHGTSRKGKMHSAGQ